MTAIVTRPRTTRPFIAGTKLLGEREPRLPCRKCGRHILPGQSAAYTDVGVVHAECPAGWHCAAKPMDDTLVRQIPKTDRYYHAEGFFEDEEGRVDVLAEICSDLEFLAVGEPLGSSPEGVQDADEALYESKLRRVVARLVAHRCAPPGLAAHALERRLAALHASQWVRNNRHASLGEDGARAWLAAFIADTGISPEPIRWTVDV